MVKCKSLRFWYTKLLHQTLVKCPQPSTSVPVTIHFLHPSPLCNTRLKGLPCSIFLLPAFSLYSTRKIIQYWPSHCLRKCYYFKSCIRISNTLDKHFLRIQFCEISEITYNYLKRFCNFSEECLLLSLSCENKLNHEYFLNHECFYSNSVSDCF